MARFNLDDYIDVQERINRFWSEYPDGAIRTDHRSSLDDFGACRYVAGAYKHRDNPFPDATGWAFEKAGGNSANATSHEENCETSAIGRALANLGYATTGKQRASRQEMDKVNRLTPDRGAEQSPRTDWLNVVLREAKRVGAVIAADMTFDGMTAAIAAAGGPVIERGDSSAANRDAVLTALKGMPDAAR